MRSFLFTKSIAALLIIALVAPATFFFAPQKASASAISCIGGLIGIGVGAGSAVTAVIAVPVNSIVGNINTGSTAGSTGASCINDMILIPLARAIIRAMLQKMTASVINWINGTPGKNGSKAPSYVQNLSVNLQGVGDAVAGPFFNQIATGLNSPFGAAISSSLRVTYLQNTSMSGFLGANQNTLPGSRQDQEAFLKGNWSQGGGIGAWFALTTQAQNNPYALYQTAQRQLGSNVAQAQTNRRQDLTQSAGFMSWCGTSDSGSSSNACVANSSGVCPSGCVPDDNAATGCSPSGSGSATAGAKVGDSCINSDGTPGSVQTPGSVIHAYTQEAVVNSGFQQLIAATDLDNALGAIVSALLNQVLGSTGLFGASRPTNGSGGRSVTSLTSQLQGFTSSNGSAAGTSVSTAQTVLDKISGYLSAWGVIETAANAASKALTSLIGDCLDATTVASAQAALSGQVTPVLAQAKIEKDIASTTAAFAIKVADEAALASSPSASATSATTLSDDLQTLIGMPPSTTDITNAQANATAGGGAVASPEGSLTVSRGTTVDQMNLISANAAALQASTVCKPVAVNNN